MGTVTQQQQYVECSRHMHYSHFYTKSSFESTGKETAKRSDERSKCGEYQGVEHGRVEPHMEHPVEHGNGNWVWCVLEHGVDFTA